MMITQQKLAALVASEARDLYRDKFAKI